jgi:hypothetical protein
VLDCCGCAAAAPLDEALPATFWLVVALPPHVLQVTRYQRGQYQRLHFDARPAGDPDGLKQFLEAGGQRLVQVVVYLNSLQPDQGGETRFFNPLLKGLAVQPRQGDALIFFPAFADGRFDDRMAHAGMPVKHGCKWICNTWACERVVPRAVTHLPLPDEEQE